mmetsp:Transcript_9863/g.14720  ORF Transcript_9863/g.14720 Transcript_9863/m.14720 type:complete len:121 (-) Transcript_9863:29-391(-)
MFLIACVLVGVAKGVPQSVNMQDMQQLTPSPLTQNIFYEFVLKHMWVCLGLFAGAVALGLVWVMLLPKNQKEPPQEESILLKGRKLLLPKYEVFLKYQKQEPTKLEKGIFKETPIRQLLE